MIILENGDKIQGSASVAAEVDYQLHGLVDNAMAALADGQLPGTSERLSHQIKNSAFFPQQWKQ